VTAAEASDAHAKRPYESSFTAKDDELPHKIAKVDDTVAAAGATSGHVAETGSLAKKAEIPTEKGTVQPQIVPGLGADPNDNVSTVLNVPGLSSVEDKATGPSTTDTSAAAIAPSTSATKADTTEKAKEPEVTKAQEETAATEPLTTAAAPAAVSEPTAAPSETTGAETATPSGATAPSETDNTAKAASAAAVAGTGVGTATSAPPAPAEPVLKVPSSIHDGPGSKVTSGNKSAAQEAVSNVKQETEGTTEMPRAAAQKIPDESRPATEVQAGTAAVKDQLPSESQAAGAAKQPEEIQKPEEAKTKEPQAVHDAREEGATTAKKPDSLEPDDIKKPEEARTKEPQAPQGAPAGAASKPEEGKTLADQAKDTEQTEANKAQDQAQENAKAEAKAEKRKSGFFGWFKRKLGGGKA
jgi:hypothetical protein